jgi:hypothetical protein
MFVELVLFSLATLRVLVWFPATSLKVPLLAVIPSVGRPEKNGMVDKSGGRGTNACGLGKATYPFNRL